MTAAPARSGRAIILCSMLLLAGAECVFAGQYYVNSSGDAVLVENDGTIWAASIEKLNPRVRYTDMSGRNRVRANGRYFRVWRPLGDRQIPPGFEPYSGRGAPPWPSENKYTAAPRTDGDYALKPPAPPTPDQAIGQLMDLSGVIGQTLGTGQPCGQPPRGDQKLTETLSTGLRQFPFPAIRGAYVQNGPNRERYTLPFVDAAIRYAAYRTQLAFGDSAALPMMIHDCSFGSGDTVPGHPGHAHRGGNNCDLGYFLKANDGVLAACSRRQSNVRCLGGPDRLDVERQAYFFAALMEVEERYGSQTRFARSHHGYQVTPGRLFENIGVDPKIRQSVMGAMGDLVRRGRVSAQLFRRADQALTSRGDWSIYHADHNHVRMFRHSPEEEQALAQNIEGDIRRMLH